MNPVTEIVLKPDGSLIRRSSVETPIAAPDALIERLSAKASCVIADVFSIQGQPAHAKQVDGRTYVTVDLQQIPMRNYWELDGKKFRPRFVQEGAPLPETYIDTTIIWLPPSGMRLKFLVLLNTGTRDGKTEWVVENAYFAAVDVENRTWRLPLPNIFNDLRCCTGNFDNKATDLRGAVDKVVSQFFNSRWGSHLTENHDSTQTEALFSFEPVNGVKQSVPFTGDWTKYCKKVGKDIFTYCVWSI